VEQLSPVQVGPGSVRLVLDARFPTGYKRNPDVPAHVIIGDMGHPERLDFSVDQEIAWTVDLDQDQNLPVDLTLYYCQSEDAQLCLIHDRRLVIPLKVTAGGSKEAHIPYEVTYAG
jgi:hypothetical protein